MVSGDEEEADSASSTEALPAVGGHNCPKKMTNFFKRRAPPLPSDPLAAAARAAKSARIAEAKREAAKQVAEEEARRKANHEKT